MTKRKILPTPPLQKEGIKCKRRDCRAEFILSEVEGLAMTALFRHPEPCPELVSGSLQDLILYLASCILHPVCRSGFQPRLAFFFVIPDTDRESRISTRSS